MAEIRFVYFDLDDTLLDHRGAERRALADLYHRYHHVLNGHDVSHIQETYYQLNLVLWQRYGHGEITQETLKRLRFEQLIEALAITSTTPEELSACYLENYARHWEWIEGAREAYLKIAEHLPTGILTNGFAHIQRAKLDQFREFEQAGALVVISDEVGYMKPDRRLFDHAARLAKTPRDQILYVGDSMHSDVEGGLGAGWQVAWYTEKKPPTDLDPGVISFQNWNTLLVRLELGTPA